MIYLLYGPPGSGKTLTSIMSAVAYQNDTRCKVYYYAPHDDDNYGCQALSDWHSLTKSDAVSCNFSDDSLVIFDEAQLLFTRDDGIDFLNDFRKKFSNIRLLCICQLPEQFSINLRSQFDRIINIDSLSHAEPATAGQPLQIQGLYEDKSMSVD